MGLKGVYGNETESKQNDFRAILTHHINTCRLIFKAYSYNPAIYRYIDVFGGPGLYDGIQGSPLIFKQAIKGMNYLADIFETDLEHYANLTQNLGADGHIRVTLGDGCDLARKLTIGTHQYGMLYCDPPQGEISFDRSFELMEHISKRCFKLDLMLYISATNLKRIRGAKGTPCLIDRIATINKKYWAIRELRGPNQYTFLVGTNYLKWVEWHKLGFFNIDSSEGIRILDRANYTREELKKRLQPPLTGLT